MTPDSEVALHAPLSKEACAEFLAVFAELESQPNEPGNPNLKPASPAVAAEMLRLIQSGAGTDLRRKCTLFAYKTIKPLKRFLQREEVQPIHVIRLLFLVDEVDKELKEAGFCFDALLDEYRAGRKTLLTLEDIAAVWRALGFDDLALGWSMFDSFDHFHGDEHFRWEPEAVWPYFSRRVELLEIALGLRKPRKRVDEFVRAEMRRNALKILCLAPEPPPSLQPILWELALGGGRSNAEMAQHALEKLPDTRTGALESLQSSKQQTRAAAATWLARLGVKEAIPLLQTTLRKEKSEAIKGEMMEALERLGCSIDEFLDLEGLQREAEKSTKVPEALKWFPFRKLPAVRWNDGKSVAPLLLQYFIVQAHRLKDPEPSPLLRRYCGMFRQSEREAFGQLVLEAWLAEDTRGWTPHRHWISQSAIAHKGVLAVAGACCGKDAAKLVLDYIKLHRGLRGAQGQALLQMLSAVEHPAAVQVLARLALRFPTRTIQDRAHALLQQVAERKGWTADQMADRNIPTLDLDSEMKVTLDYGKRVFYAWVSPDLQITLKDKSGSIIKTLPEPRWEERTEAPDAKRALKTLKRDLKSVLQTQRDRLFEAMVTQRSWVFEEWDTFLNQHTLVRRLCQGLVWAAFDGDRLLATFRPLDDGTLTDVKDNPVQLNSATTVRLAHECNLPEKLRGDWLQHLTDYKVEPPFNQFGRAAFRLPQDKARDTELTDFEGHVVDGLKLRSAATKLGYRRGAAQDGATFYDYRKAFPGVQLEAIVEFTGTMMGDEDRPVALRALRIVRRATGPGQRTPVERPVALGELPPVLLSECWNDYREMALQGSGFDANWEQKTAL